MNLNRQKPPIVAILFLVVFLMAVLYFVASQQLENSKAHRLRLLAGFSSRVEATVPDLAQRFVRIARETRDREKVREYVNQIPYLTYLPEETEPPEAPSPQPPSLTVEPLGPYVYLVYRGPGFGCDASDQGACQHVQVKARLDLEALLAPAVLPDAFDSVLLAQAQEGKVLFQQGEPELRLTSLASVDKSTRNGDGEERGGWPRFFPGSERIDISLFGLSGSPSTGSVPVEVAEVEYRLFFQPVVLDLPALRQEKSQPPLHWVAGGFVARDRLLSASFTSSPILLFALLAIFPLGVLAWPFLKLGLVSSRQRLTRLDVGFLVLSTVLGCFLLTLLVLDLVFWHQMRSKVDGQLAGLAEQLERDFMNELGQAYSQLKVIHGKLADLKNQNGDSGTDSQEGIYCEDPTCRPRLTLPFSISYPIFHSVFWVDRCGGQQTKIAFRKHSLRKTNVSERPYFECAMGRASPYRVLLPGESGEVALCLESVISNTGGADQAILAVPGEESLERCEGTEQQAAGDGELRPILATRLASLTQAVLPPTYAFAVIDRTRLGQARVLFHSDSRRILSENLLKASDENALLASMLESRRMGSLTLRYWGQRHRAHVRPLKELPWVLVTFRTIQDLRMRNLELFYDVAIPAVLFFVLLLTALLFARGGSIFRTSLWPDPQKNRIYSWIVIISVFVAGVFCLLLGWAERRAPRHYLLLLLATIGLPLATLALSFVALWLQDRGKVSRRWEHSKQGWRESSVRKCSGFLESRLEKDHPIAEYILLGVGAVLGLLGTVATPGVATIGLLLATVVSALFWIGFYKDFRHPFQQRRTYIFATTSLLFLGSIVPATGLFSLARERQYTFLVQETQEGLLPALEEQQRETIESRDEKRPFFEKYGSKLEDLREGLLKQLFFTRVDEVKPKADPRDPGETAPTSLSWPWDGWPSKLFSSRPIPVNDLSTSPRGVDLSRFKARDGSWSWVWPWSENELSNGGASGPRVQGELRAASNSSIWRFQSTVPPNRLTIDIDQVTSDLIPLFLFVFLALAWLASPYLAVRLIADRVLLATLAPVREEKTKKEGNLLVADGGEVGRRDLADLRELLNPAYLEQERMLLVLGVPELALQVVRELGEYQEVPWTDDELWLRKAKQEEQEERSRTEKALHSQRSGAPLVITRFSIDFEQDERAAEATSAKLSLLSRWHREQSRAIVLFADIEPREILRSAEIEEDSISTRATLRRQWAALLGSFTFHYASDRGNVEKLQDAIRERRMAVVRSWSQKMREGIEPIARKRKELEELERRLEVDHQRILEAKDHDASDASGKKLQQELEASVESIKGEIAELEKEIKIDDRVRESAKELGRKWYQAVLDSIDILEEECAPTAQLQRIGRQILPELAPGDFGAFSRDKMVAKIALRARTYYHAIWSATSEDEKVVLAQLAYTGLVSPKNCHRVLDLMYRGLIVRRPKLRLMNDSFALFIRQMVSKAQLLEWEGEEATSLWSILRWLLPVPLLLLGGFVFITQRDAVSSALGFLLAAASVAPTLINLFGYFEQRFAQRVAQERERGRQRKAERKSESKKEA